MASAHCHRPTADRPVLDNGAQALVVTGPAHPLHHLGLGDTHVTDDAPFSLVMPRCPSRHPVVGGAAVVAGSVAVVVGAMVEAVVVGGPVVVGCAAVS